MFMYALGVVLFCFEVQVVMVVATCTSKKQPKTEPENKTHQTEQP
jgi:hypothetical protein